MEEKNTVEHEQERPNVNVDVTGEIARLNQERVQNAQREIQAVLDKYKVKLVAYAVVPVQDITVTIAGG